VSRVDVVIPAYNAAAFIEDALASVVAQGDCVASIIVVDDGSRDATVATVEAFGRRHPGLVLACLRQANAGPSAARNRGLAQVRAEFVAMLDADDVWEPHKLRRQLEAFDRPRFERLGVVYCGFGLLSEAGEPMENRGFRLDPTVRGDVAERLLEGNLIAGSASAVLIRRECLERVGTFDERLVCAEDWDLWLRIAEHYSFDCVEEDLVWVRQHPSNAQKNELRMLGGELLFLNKLYLAGKARWYHFARLWRRLVVGGYDARELKGFASCDWRVRLLMTGTVMKLMALGWRLRGYAGRVRRLPADVFYRVYPHVPAFIRAPLKRVWLAVRPGASR
jgi:glycosyltransferase involved in cell wall biosynthesis